MSMISKLKNTGLAAIVAASTACFAPTENTLQEKPYSVSFDPHSASMLAKLKVNHITIYDGGLFGDFDGKADTIRLNEDTTCSTRLDRRQDYDTYKSIFEFADEALARAAKTKL